MVFDEEVFAMIGTVMKEIKNVKQLKKWYVHHDKIRTNKTTAIIELVKSGKSDIDLLKINEFESFLFHNFKKLKTFRVEYNKSIKFQPVQLPRIVLSTLNTLHPSSQLILRWFDRTVCGGDVTKGTGWLHLFSISNMYKSWFIRFVFFEIVSMCYVLFVKGWPQGFEENKFRGICVDGVSRETIDNGFSYQLIEHATVGRDDHFIFPMKYCIESPKTNGEFWVTTGNAKISDIVSEQAYQDIVKNRVCEVEIREETELVKVANIIRTKCNLSPIPAPNLIQPECYYFSQI